MAVLDVLVPDVRDCDGVAIQKYGHLTKPAFGGLREMAPLKFSKGEIDSIFESKRENQV